MEDDMIKKKAWFDLDSFEGEICCQRLADEEEIAFQNGIWFCYGDGVIQVNDIKYCPFCGEQLPIYMK